MPDITLSTTAFGDASSCLKKYEYRHIDKLIPRPRDVPRVMRRGTWIHRCLELLDRGHDWTEELSRLAVWAVEHEIPEADVLELAEEVEGIVSDYVSYWSGHEENQYETVSTEEPIFWSPAPGKTIRATVDRIVRDRKGRLWVWERKSTGEIPGADWRCVDPQTMLQFLAARQSGKYHLTGVIFDYVLTNPGPKMRVKKDGRLYAGLEDKEVTSRAFDGAVPTIRANWQDGPDWQSADSYIHHLHSKMVNDGRWFQRYVVFRPDESAVQTLKDVAFVMRQLEGCQSSGYYPRSLNVFTCRRFCPYAALCSLEYTTGRSSYVTRDELFVVETPELRAEGRSEN